jgi:hypothetical protein
MEVFKMARKVLRLTVKARCNRCSRTFEINDLIAQAEAAHGDHFKPFGAKEASSSVYCPDCCGFDFELNYDYKNVYRHRCKKCNEMFDAYNTWEGHCPKCEKEEREAWALMGAGLYSEEDEANVREMVKSTGGYKY